MTCFLLLLFFEARVNFRKEVLPILEKHCVRCHGAENAARGLRLHTRERAMLAIVPGKPEESRAFTAARSGMMPPPGVPKLTPAEIETFRKWILEGARWRPRDLELRHLAGQSLVPPPPPPARSEQWDERAGYLLPMVEKATASLFRAGDLVLDSRCTERDGLEGDILYVVWTFGGTDAATPKGWISLRDSGSFSTYTVRWNGAPAATVAAEETEKRLAQFLILAKWLGERPICLDPAERRFRLRWGGPTDAHVYDLNGEGDETGWEIHLTIGKRLLSEFYGNTMGVTERFPPLSELVRSWEVERIYAALSEVVHTTYSRDAVLLAELARRGPEDDSLLLAALSRAARSKQASLLLDTRMYQIFDALRPFGDPSRSERFAEASLDTLESIGPDAAEAINNALRHLGCSERLERRVALVPAATAYLKRCGDRHWQ